MPKYKVLNDAVGTVGEVVALEENQHTRHLVEAGFVEPVAEKPAKAKAAKE